MELITPLYNAVVALGAVEFSWVVLDRNPLDIPTSDLHNVEVLTTVFSGREVYSKD
jgi:hypothetical protein